ncbi:MAG TPA: PEGA domain-containing protein, partial [Polyangiaceae bacterium]|nr:PEGA domain-containing protein [Polyangiaceae bacterium]
NAIGHYAVAVDWYDKFLAHVPDKMGSAADDLKKREAEIKAMPGRVHVESTPPGASVAVDDKPANGVTPMDLELPAGAHKVTLTAQGHLAQDKPLDVSFASTQTVAVELAAEPPPAPPPPPVAVVTPPPAPAPAPPPPPASPLPAYITGGIAIAAVAVGTGFGIAALNDKSDFFKNPTSSTADNGDTHALIADMSFGIAITFGVTSAVLFLTKDEAAAGSTSSASSATKTASRSPAKPKTKHLPAFVPAPMVGPHLGGASFTWRF